LPLVPLATAVVLDALEDERNSTTPFVAASLKGLAGRTTSA
jgi:hypothetical protein